jgi:hypothetical protein
MGGNSRRVVAQPLVRLSGDYPEAIMLDLVRCPDWLEAMLEAGRTVQPVIANFYDWGATSRQKAMHVLCTCSAATYHLLRISPERCNWSALLR